MELRRPETLARFRAATQPFLLRHEAEHGLLLGVAGGRPAPSADAYWALVEEEGRVVAAALRTTDKLIVSREAAPGAMRRLARDAGHAALRAVLGPPASVAAFMEGMVGPWREGMAQRIYEVRDVVPPRAVPGARRLARPADQALLAERLDAFAAEAVDETLARDAAERAADRLIAGGALHVWEVDGRVTASAAAQGPTPNGMRVAAVYTPPELRGRGYASALVAALSDHLLSSGRAFVFLYADLANPTSNGIYQRIGYRAVADVRMVWRADVPAVR